MLSRLLVPMLFGIAVTLAIVFLFLHVPQLTLPEVEDEGSTPPAENSPMPLSGTAADSHSHTVNGNPGSPAPHGHSVNANPGSAAPHGHSVNANPGSAAPHGHTVNAKPGSAAPDVHTSETIAVVAEPDAITAVVNKHKRLPEGYKPEGLTYPNIPFVFNERLEKRMLRKPAALALEKLAAAARKEGLTIKGVSGYRSHKRQKELFERYVKRDGFAKASIYSAYPGTSEHETGLAIDITGGDGSCAAEDCFARKPEARWVADHAHEYGFIVRYPKGKENLTGYKYEPWHLRYVGKQAAELLHEHKLTLEEYTTVLDVME